MLTRRIYKIFRGFINVGYHHGAFPFRFIPESNSVENCGRWQLGRWIFSVAFTTLATVFFTGSVIYRSAIGQFSIQNPVDGALWYFFMVSNITLGCHINTVLHRKELVLYLNQFWRYCEYYMKHYGSDEMKEAAVKRKERGARIYIKIMRMVVIMRTIGSIRKCKANLAYMTYMVCNADGTYANIPVFIIANFFQYYFFTMLTNITGFYFVVFFQTGFRFRDMMKDSMKECTAEKMDGYEFLLHQRAVLVLGKMANNALSFVLPSILFGAMNSYTFANFVLIREFSTADYPVTFARLGTWSLLTLCLYMLTSAMGPLTDLFSESVSQKQHDMGQRKDVRLSMRSLQEFRIRIGPFGHFRKDTYLEILEIVFDVTFTLLMTF